MSRPTALAFVLAGLLGSAAVQAQTCDAPAADAAAAQDAAMQPHDPTAQPPAVQDPSPPRAGVGHACREHGEPSSGADPAATEAAATAHGDTQAGGTHGQGMDHSVMHHHTLGDDAPPAGTDHADPQPAAKAHGDAQGGTTHRQGMDHAAMHHAARDQGEAQTGTDHAAMQPASTGHGDAHADTAQRQGMDHSSMDHAAMGHGDAKPGDVPLPPPTAAERAAAFPVLQSHAMHGTQANHYVLLDRLEGWDADPGAGQAWEATAWYGGDVNRLWLRSEGERSGGRTESAQLEALYGRAISPWWDVLAGVRHDTGPGAGRSWAALGVQGLAPYKFELAATLYLSDHGDGALRLEGEYDVLLTNRLILQPRIEADVGFGGDDARDPASGLQTVEAGLRLRYEITRRFAPYLGWVHERRFGSQADRARAQDDAPRDSRWVAGVRIWF